MSDAHILVVDDERQIRKFLRIALEAHGFTVHEATTGQEGTAACALNPIQLVVLDLGLPDKDGKDVIRTIREWSDVPILVLSIRQAEREKVDALDAGANDYLVKPFGVAEFMARVRAALRNNQGQDSQAEAVIGVGDLAIDVARHEARLSGRPLALTPKEFQLLSMLGRNVGRLVTHRQLLRTIWGPAHENDTQYLRVFIGQLRGKLGDDPADPKFILNEPGVGYRLLEQA